MRISARLQNDAENHHVTLRTDDHAHVLSVLPKPDGRGSSVNGGELRRQTVASASTLSR
jgi:hypothetical protein